MIPNTILVHELEWHHRYVGVPDERDPHFPASTAAQRSGPGSHTQYHKSVNDCGDCDGSTNPLGCEPITGENRQERRSWQLNRATALIEPHGGVIVAEYFDMGQSRALTWQRRPEASRLLAALRDPNRGFDAVVIGEPHRAFYGNQFGLTFPLFTHYNVQLWMPEIGGPLDADNEAHDLVMSVFGGMSKGERNRIKVRVRTAMVAQTKLEGRYLGGRPPYGYRLADLGPHPNPGKATDGRRLHGLAPDQNTAPVVARIFAEFLAGCGLYAFGSPRPPDGAITGTRAIGQMPTPGPRSLAGW